MVPYPRARIASFASLIVVVAECQETGAWGPFQPFAAGWGFGLNHHPDPFEIRSAPPYVTARPSAGVVWTVPSLSKAASITSAIT